MAAIASAQAQNSRESWLESFEYSKLAPLGTWSYRLRVYPGDRYDWRITKGSHVEEGRRGHLPSGTYHRVLKTLEMYRFGDFREAYDKECFLTDMPRISIALYRLRAGKRLRHDLGCVEFPRERELRELERELELALGIEGWKLRSGE